MAITPLTVTIDLNPSYKKIPAVYVSQLDNNLRFLAITVQDGGVNYDVASSGYDVYVEGTKPDKHGFSYKVTDIGGTVVGSVVTVPMQTQMTCVQGMVPTEIVLKSGADRIGSANFLLVVERAGLDEDTDVSETDIPGYIDGAQRAAAAAEDAKDLAVAAKDTAVSVAASIPADYTTLSNDVDDLKSALRLDHTSGKQTFALYATFDHYGLKNDGSFQTNQKYRVSCDNTTKIQFDSATVVKAASGFKWGYIPFNGDTAGTWSGWFETATIMPNVPFVIQIARVDEILSEIADVNEFVSAITFETFDSIALDEIKSKYMTAILGCLKNVIYESPNGAVWFNRLKALNDGYKLYDYLAYVGPAGQPNRGIIADITILREYIVQVTVYHTNATHQVFVPLFATDQSGKKIAAYVRPYDKKLGYWYSGVDTVTDIYGMTPNQKHTITFKPVGMSETYPNNETVSVDDVEYNTTSTASGGTLSTYFGIFANANSATTSQGITQGIGQRVGEIIITNRSGDIIYDLVPAFDGTKYGYLELKEYRFIYNADYYDNYVGGNW